MKCKIDDFQMAYDFVNSAPYGENSAVLRKDTGRILYHSAMGDMDEISDEDWESDYAVEVPHKNDLDLGTRLVFDFVRTNLPDDYDNVRQIFSRLGATVDSRTFSNQRDSSRHGMTTKPNSKNGLFASGVKTTI